MSRLHYFLMSDHTLWSFYDLIGLVKYLTYYSFEQIGFYTVEINCGIKD